MERKLTCIVCPMGCELTVNIEGKKVTDVSGNTCPQRTVTSTVRCTDGGLVSVKTDRPIPKEKTFQCMKIINQTVATLPISVGDVIAEDVFGSNIVATQNRGKDSV